MFSFRRDNRFECFAGWRCWWIDYPDIFLGQAAARLADYQFCWQRYVPGHILACHQRQKHFSRPPALLVKRLPDRGERGGGEFGFLQVIEPDHTYIIWNAQASFPQGAYSAQGHLIIG